MCGRNMLLLEEEKCYVNENLAVAASLHWNSPHLALQLDALVAVAHAIPALYRLEHPGDDAESLGADDFLPIFIFILVNSRIERVAAQSLILETLCDPKRIMGEAGESFRACKKEDRKREASEEGL